MRAGNEPEGWKSKNDAWEQETSLRYGNPKTTHPKMEIIWGMEIQKRNEPEGWKSSDASKNEFHPTHLKTKRAWGMEIQRNGNPKTKTKTTHASKNETSLRDGKRACGRAKKQKAWEMWGRANLFIYYV